MTKNCQRTMWNDYILLFVAMGRQGYRVLTSLTNVDISQLRRCRRLKIVEKSI